MKKKNKTIAVIGGGIAGLAAGYKLAKNGYKVSLFEPKDLGGLASTFKIERNDIEKYYHHIFQSDKSILELASELGIEDYVEFKRTKTAVFDGEIYPLSNVYDYLKQPRLDMKDKIYSGIKIMVLKYQKWQDLTEFPLTRYLPRLIGENSYCKLWDPLIRKKFGKYSDKIMMPWFWSRIKYRTKNLGYFKGSLKVLINSLVEKMEKMSGIIINEEVKEILLENNLFKLKTANNDYLFHYVIVTTPPQVFSKIANKILSKSYLDSALTTTYIGSKCLILLLKNRLTDYYWININNIDSPFVACIEHTNFRDPQEYNGKHIVYLSIYCPHNELFKISKNKIIKDAVNLLKKLNNGFTKDWIVESYLFSSPNTQHIADSEYYKNLPEINTPIKNLYQISTSHIFPNDRGVNKAIEMADKVTAKIN